MTIGKLFKLTKELVTVCDLFCTTQLLRYRQNPQFKSANGGLCSIAVILAFTVIFTQTVFNTFAKTNISSQTALSEETDPSHFTTAESPFLFAVGVAGYNLNSATTKYFNIQLSQKSKEKGHTTTIFHNLTACNRSSWTAFDSALGDSFDKIGLQSWLCLPSNIPLQFTGKFTSDIFKYIKIALKPCSILAGDNRTCINESLIDSNIDTNGPISFNYYFVNTIINSDDAEYLGFYLEDRNYFKFTKQMGTSANIFISSYDIETDESLWPWVEKKNDIGGIVHENTQTYVYTPNANLSSAEYISLFLRKSSLSLTITRSFRKYDDTLSYIGGLFSTFMVTLFVMSKYNQYAYQIEIASKIYKYKKARSIQTNKFNLLSFFAYSFYCVLDFINIAPKWKIMHHFDVVREEIAKQLDLRLLIRKISFLQDCIGYLFEDYELQCLHLKGKMTLEQASIIRKRFSSRKKLFNLKKRLQNKANSDSQQLTGQKDHQGSIQLQNRQADNPRAASPSKQNNKVSDLLISTQNQIKKASGSKQEESDSSSEEEEEQNQKKILADYIGSINQVKLQAKKGNARCKKIYKNLDQTIKELPYTLNLPEQNETKVVLNETEEQINFPIATSKNQILLMINRQ